MSAPAPVLPSVAAPRKVSANSAKAKAAEPGLKIMGAAAKESTAGGEAKAVAAAVSNGEGKRKKVPKPRSVAAAAAAAGDAPGAKGGSSLASKSEPGWKAKQAAKNKAAFAAAVAAADGGSTSSSNPNPKAPQPHFEPLLTTNRSKLPSFSTRGRPPAPMYSSPHLPHSYSTGSDPRATAPEPSSSHTPLHRHVLHSWVSSRPRPETLAARTAALDKVARAVSAFPGSYQLALFGSVANGVDNDASDLDICVIDDSRPSGYDPSLDTSSNRKGIFNMYQLGDKLALQGLDDIVPIPYSNTPIVKCRDPDSDIELDLNVNDLGGVYNTNLIESYCYLSPYALRPLLNAVKRWGKARSVASQAAFHPAFSSYGLNLLCIAYLLCTQPPGSNDGHPYLPNLQSTELLDTYNVPLSTIDVRVTKKDRVGTTIDTTFVPVHQHASGGNDGGAWGMSAEEIRFWQGRNADVDLGELVTGFFRFYAGLDGRGWDWHQEGVSILHGGRISRATSRQEYMMSKVGLAAAAETADDAEIAARLDKHAVQKLVKSWSDDAMLIQDPFIVTKNCAKPISFKTAGEIEEEFQRASLLLDVDTPASFDELCQQYTGNSLRARKQERNPHQPRATMRPRGKMTGQQGGRKRGPRTVTI